MLSKDNQNNKNSGILLHISSLSSPYGIGTFGKEAYEFIDFLKEANQRYWQLLPLVPLGEGNSPYKSSSCYAGEILYIDLDILVSEGLLKKSDIPIDPFIKGQRVDFEKVRAFKLPLIKKATENFSTENDDYKRFIKDNSFWLYDYAVFAAALEYYNTDKLHGIDRDLRLRKPEALETFCNEQSESIEFYIISQYLFYAQFYNLKRYAVKNGILLIGDIPIYVSLDSAEVWTSPENFLLNEDMTPKVVAGVPPDMFSKTGQLWGNPIYNWQHMKADGYRWWKNRIKRCGLMFDVIRIDHFRAFADYYTIPFGSLTAVNGEWFDGPDTDFWNSVSDELGDMNIIAEDLGCYSPKVEKLIKATGFPNMKVIQFAFSGGDDNEHLPINYDGNCVCYTGTHDNDTSLGWYINASDYERMRADTLFPTSPALPVPLNFIKAALISSSKAVIIPIQDWLMEDSSARMNIPGVPKGNWGYRIKENSLSSELINRIKNL